MTTGSHESGPAPVLVLGLGNTLLHDDGVGQAVLAGLAAACGELPELEFVDGGTRGIVLAGLLDGRRALLLLDAVALGSAPGTIHVIEDPQNLAIPRGTGAHEANVGEVLTAAALTGDLPGRIVMVGVEPDDLRTGMGLSPAVEAAVAPAVVRARDLVGEMLALVAGS